MKTLNHRALCDAFGTFMTGVTVVTANHKGNPIGFTANSFASVSLEPPLVLVCLDNRSQNYDAFVNNKGFAVNVLSAHQKEISNTFAKQVTDRFAKINWDTGPFGAPIIDEVSAWFDCSMHQTIDAGDHCILIGKVEAFNAKPIPSLGYVRGAYVTPTAEIEALNQSSNLYVSAIITRNNKVLLIQDNNGGWVLPEVCADKSGATAALAMMIKDSGISAEAGFIYSVFEDDKQQHISFLCHAADEGVPNHGSFIALTDDELNKIHNPAVRSMLARFAAESRVGTYGIYYGTQSDGTVRAIV